MLTKEEVPNKIMSERARELFNRYVVDRLNHPDLKGLSVESHVFNLNYAAREAHIPLSELIEEVGPLAQALVSARRRTPGSPLPT